MTPTATTPRATGVDRALARSAATGDPAAFAALHRRHDRRMRRIAASILHDRHEAEDVAQETWIRAAARLDALEDPGAWLATVARNEALRVLAGRRRRPVPLEATPERPDPHADPAARAESAETARQVRRVVAGLPAPYRESAVRELAGQTPAEAARVIGISAGAARVRAHRARRMMADGLRATGVAA